MNWRVAVVVNLIVTFNLVDKAAFGVETTNLVTPAVETRDLADKKTGTSSRRVKLRAAVNVLPAAGETRTERTRTVTPSLNQEQETEATDMLLLVRRAVVAIVLSGGLAIALFLAVGKRSMSAKGSGSAADLELLGTLSLAPRCCVSLIRAQHQTILVARDSSGVKQMIVLGGGFEALLDQEASSRSPTQLRQY